MGTRIECLMSIRAVGLERTGCCLGLASENRRLAQRQHAGTYYVQVGYDISAAKMSASSLGDLPHVTDQYRLLVMQSP